MIQEVLAQQVQAGITRGHSSKIFISKTTETPTRQQIHNSSYINYHNIIFYQIKQKNMKR